MLCLFRCGLRLFCVFDLGRGLGGYVGSVLRLLLCVVFFGEELF